MSYAIPASDKKIQQNEYFAVLPEEEKAQRHRKFTGKKDASDEGITERKEANIKQNPGEISKAWPKMKVVARIDCVARLSP